MHSPSSSPPSTSPSPSIPIPTEPNDHLRGISKTSHSLSTDNENVPMAWNSSSSSSYSSSFSPVSLFSAPLSARHWGHDELDAMDSRLCFLKEKRINILSEAYQRRFHIEDINTQIQNHRAMIECAHQMTMSDVEKIKGNEETKEKQKNEKQKKIYLSSEERKKFQLTSDSLTDIDTVSLSPRNCIDKDTKIDIISSATDFLQYVKMFSLDFHRTKYHGELNKLSATKGVTCSSPGERISSPTPTSIVHQDRFRSHRDVSVSAKRKGQHEEGKKDQSKDQDSHVEEHKSPRSDNKKLKSSEPLLTSLEESLLSMSESERESEKMKKNPFECYRQQVIDSLQNKIQILCQKRHGILTISHSLASDFLIVDKEWKRLKFAFTQTHHQIRNWNSATPTPNPNESPRENPPQQNHSMTMTINDGYQNVNSTSTSASPSLSSPSSTSPSLVQLTATLQRSITRLFAWKLVEIPPESVLKGHWMEIGTATCVLNSRVFLTCNHCCWSRKEDSEKITPLLLRLMSVINGNVYWRECKLIRWSSQMDLAIIEMTQENDVSPFIPIPFASASEKMMGNDSDLDSSSASSASDSLPFPQCFPPNLYFCSFVPRTFHHPRMTILREYECETSDPFRSEKKDYEEWFHKYLQQNELRLEKITEKNKNKHSIHIKDIKENWKYLQTQYEIHDSPGHRGRIDPMKMKHKEDKRNHDDHSKVMKMEDESESLHVNVDVNVKDIRTDDGGQTYYRYEKREEDEERLGAQIISKNMNLNAMDIGDEEMTVYRTLRNHLKKREANPAVLSETQQQQQPFPFPRKCHHTMMINANQMQWDADRNGNKNHENHRESGNVSELSSSSSSASSLPIIIQGRPFTSIVSDYECHSTSAGSPIVQIQYKYHYNKYEVESNGINTVKMNVKITLSLYGIHTGRGYQHGDIMNPSLWNTLIMTADNDTKHQKNKNENENKNQNFEDNHNRDKSEVDEEDKYKNFAPSDSAHHCDSDHQNFHIALSKKGNPISSFVCVEEIFTHHNGWSEWEILRDVEGEFANGNVTQRKNFAREQKEFELPKNTGRIQNQNHQEDEDEDHENEQEKEKEKGENVFRLSFRVPLSAIILSIRLWSSYVETQIPLLIPSLFNEMQCQLHSRSHSQSQVLQDSHLRSRPSIPFDHHDVMELSPEVIHILLLYVTCQQPLFQCFEEIETGCWWQIGYNQCLHQLISQQGQWMRYCWDQGTFEVAEPKDRNPPPPPVRKPAQRNNWGKKSPNGGYYQ